MSCTAFLLGLAAHEVPERAPQRDDPWHPLVCLVRATKPWPSGTTARLAPYVRRAANGDGVVLLYHRVNGTATHEDAIRRG